jgi:hypothetical protein
MKGTPTLSSREHPLVVPVQSEARHHRLSRYRVLLSPNQMIAVDTVITINRHF